MFFGNFFSEMQPNTVKYFPEIIFRKIFYGEINRPLILSIVYYLYHILQHQKFLYCIALVYLWEIWFLHKYKSALALCTKFTQKNCWNCLSELCVHHIYKILKRKSATPWKQEKWFYVSAVYIVPLISKCYPQIYTADI